MLVIVIDVLLIGVLVVALVVGVRRGLLASLGALIGIVLGSLAAFWLVPIVNDLWPWQNTRVLRRHRPRAAPRRRSRHRGRRRRRRDAAGCRPRAPLRVIDRFLGGVLAVLVGALTLSMVGSTLAKTGTPVVSTALASSQVLRAIDALTPAPVDETLARVQSAVMDQGIPQLGRLLDQEVQPTAPPVALDDPVLAEAAASVARVSGVAYRVRDQRDGLGLRDRAGPRRDQRARRRGRGHPDRRTARAARARGSGRLLRSDRRPRRRRRRRPGRPSAAGRATARGGECRGRSRDTRSAVRSRWRTPPCCRSARCRFRTSTSESSAPRDIYALEAPVHPGNSGGPLLTSDGAVAGVVFARAETDADRGYAMTTTELEGGRRGGCRLDVRGLVGQLRAMTLRAGCERYACNASQQGQQPARESLGS